MRAAIEPIRDADVEAVAALEIAAFPLTPHGEIADVASRLRGQLAAPWTRAWVARDEADEVVGYLVTMHAADEIHVIDVATRASHRRRGIGRALMDHLVALGAREKARLLVLEVRRSNVGAIRLYRRVGFAAISVRSRYYIDDEDAIEMHLLFDGAGNVVARGDEVRLEDA